ncbi:sugar ABC transporter substrate-binding protein [Caldifermentibacillus hisashii]|uniref:Sugar ABC transporter substrate-binding protein n=1 Tax=Caldifermentibacillus hisashii TaxID=996558 RepID=A0ABU9K1C7_9BACI|nr:sugar ABC transporter substrate-binding protein [Caldibacillus thermoamylovorans]MCM3054221.1 sugar ABC transporter substrate-binding protein [Caldibacillus thermoamylovorans]
MFKGKKYKLLISVLLGMLLSSFVLAGCGNGNNAKDGKNGKTTITVWGMGEEAKSLPEIAKKFEEQNPNIKVNIQAIPWDQAHDKLLTAVASKIGPDVIQMGTTWIPEFAAAGALMDLSSSYEDYPALDPSNFSEGSIETTQYDGKTVAVPWYIDTRVLYYRTDLLAEVGYNEAPKTWEELSDAAQKLALRGDGKYGISIDTKEQSLAFMFARQNGSKLLDENGNPLFDQPEFVEAVKYLNSFFENGSAPIDLGLDITQTFGGDGIIPMFISGPWMVKLISEQAPDIEGKWATAVLPSGKENNTSILGGSNLSVFEYSKNKKAALKFVSFMSEPETQIEWMNLTNSLPAADDAWNNEELANNKLYKTFGEQLQSARPMPMIPEFEQIAQTFLSSFERIYRGQKDINSEIKTFNEQAKDILEK